MPIGLSEYAGNCLLDKSLFVQEDHDDGDKRWVGWVKVGFDIH
jgi:hypothetical protein